MGRSAVPWDAGSCTADVSAGPAAGASSPAAARVERSGCRRQAPDVGGHREGEPATDAQTLVGEGERRLDEVLGADEDRGDDAADDGRDAPDDARHGVLTAAGSLRQLMSRALLLLAPQFGQQVGADRVEQLIDSLLLVVTVPLVPHQLAGDQPPGALSNVVLSPGQLVDLAVRGHPGHL